MIIKDSVFLVTGGSSGNGETISQFLLGEGAFLTILDLKPLNKRILNHGDRVLFLQVDVTSEKDVSNALYMTDRTFGKLNGVINCAQVKFGQPVFNVVSNVVQSLQEFVKMLDINLIGTFNVIRLSIPLLTQNADKGIVINTCSIFGHKGSQGYVAYSASEAGIIGMTNPLSKELNEYGIRVVDLALVNTPDLISIGKSEKELESQLGKFIKSVIETETFNGLSLKF